MLCRLAEALEDEGGGGQPTDLPFYGDDSADSQLLGKNNKGVCPQPAVCRGIDMPLLAIPVEVQTLCRATGTGHPYCFGAS